MPFPDSVKEEALVRSRRCCNICQQFAGLYTNVHHIVPESDGGPNNLGNAIVLCLRCHGEAGHYNVKHPIGNKYSPTELRRHRDEWWEWCKKNPAVPLSKHPISISPGSVSLGAQNWRVLSLFKVHNKTNEIYYQIWVKLTIDTPNMHIQDISIELPNPTDELHIDIGKISISGNILIFRGTDQTSYKAIYLVLESLNPGEIFPFILTNNAPYMPSTSSQLNASILSFDKVPAPIYFQPGKSGGFSFKTPEKFKLESAGFLMKRLQ